MYETLIINGRDVRDYCVDITVIDGLYSMAVARGDNIVIPGVDGEIKTDKPYQTNVVELGLILKGNTTAEFNTALRALRSICPPNHLLSLERRMSFTTGNESHYALGEYTSGLSPTIQLARFGRTTLGVKVLEGVWHGNTDICVNVNNSSMNVAGDGDTHRLTVTLPAVSSLTNTTTGHTMTMAVPTDIGSGSVTVDVEACVATLGTTDVSNYLSWGATRYAMRLTPGTNAFTGSAATVCYKPAYL